MLSTKQEISENKISILILNYEYPPLGGGAGAVSKYHAENLAKKGYKVTVLTTWYKGEKEYEQIGNLTVIKLKSRRKYNYKSTPDEWISWIFLGKKFLSDYLKENKFDYCFAHFALPGGEVAKYIHKKFKLPYAVISHGQDIPWFFPKQMFKYHIITYFWIKTICKRADKLILLTRAMKKNADRFAGKQKFKNIIVPNGCDTTLFYPVDNMKNSIFTVLFAGRLVEQKDPFTFLKAIKKIKTNKPFKVFILGDGPLRNKMQRFVIKNGLEKNIVFKGWVSKPEIIKHYRTAHVLVSSSKEEAMSIAALEALSTGIYMISTPVSGNTDIIKKGINGDFFEYGDSTGLAKKLEICIEQKEKCTVNKDYLNKFRKEYDWKNITEKLTEILPDKKNGNQ